MREEHKCDLCGAVWHTAARYGHVWVLFCASCWFRVDANCRKVV